jgi:hypothetical protein
VSTGNGNGKTTVAPAVPPLVSNQDSEVRFDQLSESHPIVAWPDEIREVKQRYLELVTASPALADSIDKAHAVWRTYWAQNPDGYIPSLRKWLGELLPQKSPGEHYQFEPRGASVSEKSPKMDRQKEQAIAALLAKPTIEEAAAAVGIGYATLRRWLQDPGFATEYRRARRDLVSQVAAQLQSAAGEAVAALVAIVRDPEAPASARVSGARTILEFTSRAVETEDLTARIETLERAAAARDGKSIRAVS